MRISDWSSDVCSSDLAQQLVDRQALNARHRWHRRAAVGLVHEDRVDQVVDGEHGLAHQPARELVAAHAPRAEVGVGHAGILRRGGTKVPWSPPVGAAHGRELFVFAAGRKARGHGPLLQGLGSTEVPVQKPGLYNQIIPPTSPSRPTATTIPKTYST